MLSDVKKAVCDAFEVESFENGIVMTQTLVEILTFHQNQMEISSASQSGAQE